MKTKLLLGTLVALITLGLAGGVAFAAEPFQRIRGLGKVTAIADDTLTVENRQGTFSVLTDDETVFRVKGIENPTIGNIQVGDIIAGQGVKREDGSLLAKVIAVVPPKQERIRGLGKVITIADDTLTVENRQGTFDVLTDDETVFRVKGIENPTIGNIQVGDIVAGQGVKREDGSLLAKVIAVVPPKQERIHGLGKVITIADGTLTVENRQGTFSVLTDDETVFRVRGVENPTIGNIQVGDIIAGQGEKREDGSLLAKVIAVVPPKQERIHGLGKVITIADGTLTVENRQGTFSVLTDDETVFRVRGVEHPTIGDIQVGDIVAGQGVKREDGSLLAKVIAVVPPKR